MITVCNTPQNNRFSGMTSTGSFTKACMRPLKMNATYGFITGHWRRPSHAAAHCAGITKKGAYSPFFDSGVLPLKPPQNRCKTVVNRTFFGCFCAPAVAYSPETPCLCGFAACLPACSKAVLALFGAFLAFFSPFLAFLQLPYCDACRCNPLLPWLCGRDTAPSRVRVCVFGFGRVAYTRLRGFGIKAAFCRWGAIGRTVTGKIF